MLALALLLVRAARAWKPLAESGCPKVYVYDAPELWNFRVPLDELHTLGRDEIFGLPCDRGVPQERRSEQQAMGAILLWRLATSARCPRVADPADADLFLVPTYPAVPKGSVAAHWQRSCADAAAQRVAARPKYLDETNAHRHLFVVSKGHAVVTRGCDAWWRRPRGLLRRAMRFAVSDAYQRGRRPGHKYGPDDFDDDAAAESMHPKIDATEPKGDYPGLVSVPYSSCIHASTNDTGPPPWADVPGRHASVLAAYVGTPHDGLEGANNGSYARVRTRLARDCDGAPDCRVHDPTASRLHTGFCGTAATHYPATFCFEPGGDSPYRKGFYDAMLAGCIPVVFGRYNARVAPWFVPPGAVVALSESRYVAGDFDAVAALRKIPANDVARMQRALADGAHRLQYAVDDVPGDAFETLLTGALDLARRKAP
jgi:hypothetical protein